MLPKYQFCCLNVTSAIINNSQVIQLANMLLIAHCGVLHASVSVLVLAVSTVIPHLSELLVSSHSDYPDCGDDCSIRVFCWKCAFY